MLKASSFTKPVHILRMQTNQFQGTIAVAYGLKSLFETFKLYEDRYGAEPTHYFTGRITDLPKPYVDRIRQDILDNKMQSFQIDIKCATASYFDKVDEFPPHVAACSCVDLNKVVESKWEFFEGEKTWECDLCDHTGIRLINKNWFDLFAADNSGWDKDVPPVKTDATVEKIYIAGVGSSYGNRQGANIMELPDTADHLPSHELMFAFDGKPSPVPAMFTNFLKAVDEEIAVQKKARNDKMTVDRREADIKQVLDGFKKIRMNASELTMIEKNMREAYAKDEGDD